MAYVTNICKTVTCPDGAPAVIRKLSWKQLRMADKANFSHNAERMRELGGEIVRAVISAGSGEEAAEKVKKIQEAQVTSPASYDMETVLIAGVSQIDGEVPKLDELDGATSKFLHEQIVAYSFEVLTKNA